MVYAWIPRYASQYICNDGFYIYKFAAGGAFDPWGGPGYDACQILTGADFMDVFYKQNWASNVKLISYYMLYGWVFNNPIKYSSSWAFRGTNWGGIAEPTVYSRSVSAPFDNCFDDSVPSTAMIMERRSAKRVLYQTNTMNWNAKRSSFDPLLSSERLIG